jgi:murein DD-endopeptidase MepM/ murein hydrolase activator NlpD
MTEFIHGTHDLDGHIHMLDKPGWLVATENLGSDPNDTTGGNYTYWTQRGFQVISRLNNGYHPVGTIPQNNEYEDFARRCANFVTATPGITVAIIGNEPNHSNERPYGEIITPTQYAKCFDLCYQRIHDAAPTIQVGVAAVAPWDATTHYPSNPNGDWVQYWLDMLLAINKSDALILHTYTHGTQPHLITSTEKMSPPFERYHYHFLAYKDFMNAIPTRYKNLPVYITETDQVVPWADHNSGWVQEAYAEIDRHNHHNSQRIHALCLYRSNQDDQWSFTDKQGVISDFKEAVRAGYRFPVLPPSTPQPPDPTPPSPPQPNPPAPDVDVDLARDIDPMLIVRGVEFDFVTPAKGTGYWKITKAQWLEDAANQVGPDHHILGRVLQDGQEQFGVKLHITWPSGSTQIVSKRDDAHALYNYDFPMSASLNEYGIWVDDADKPSDSARGIGMGKNGNPREHTSTWINFEWTIAEGIIDPIPPTPPPDEDMELVHPLMGSVITQHFYQNPQNYAQFGLPGHNGTDLGGKSSRTPVLSVAKGIVAFVGTDAAYGNYVRVKHQQNELQCYTFFAHLDSISVAAGQVVEPGQEVGKLGTTGNSTGVHLHIEVRMMYADGTYVQGTPMPKGRVDPQTFLIDRGLRL